MRRPCAMLLVITLTVVTLAGVPGEAQQPVCVFVHGDHVPFRDQQPIIIDGRMLVPIRGLFEALGAQVKWEASALRATVIWRGNQAAVFIGSRRAWVNGQEKLLDIAPRIIGDRTMVPLRFLAEALGRKVDWYERYQAVVIGERPTLAVLAPVGNPDLVMPCTIRVAIRPVPNGAYEPPRT